MNENNTGARKAVIGQPMNRVDGQAKVTGAATYSAEYKLPNTAHAVVVGSRISRGRIRSIDSTDAKRAPGVLAVMTRENIPRWGKPGDTSALVTAPGESRLPMQDDEIHHAGQYIAVVVAETLEQAEHSARLVRVEYDEQKPLINMEAERARAEQPEKFFGFEDLQVKRGDARAAFDSAAAKLEQNYTTPHEHHNPLEPHATVAVWETPDKVTIYDATQAVVGSQKIFAGMLGLPDENVRIIARFIGGGFGCKGLVWGHPLLAAVAAKQLKRPVKLVLSRQQMVMTVGHRGETSQKLSLGSSRDGKLTALRHESDTQVSPIGDFLEPPGLASQLLYAAPNFEMVHNTVKLNIGTPTPMRAPGESPGMFALESALDELAFDLKIDPVEIRVKNHADINPKKNLPWSSKFLKECYQQGAERIGWGNRKQQPRANRQGRWLVGYGVATATYPGYRSPAAARARINRDGSVVVGSATQDIGTGTYTVMAQIAADALQIPVERVRVELGDSTLPMAPTSGGSQTVASVGPAIQEACEAAMQEIIKLAINDKSSPLSGKRAEEIGFREGRIFVKNDSSRVENFTEILRRAGRQSIEACVTTQTVTSEAMSEARNPAVQASAEGGKQNGAQNGGGQTRAGAGSPLCMRLAADKDTDANEEKYAFQSHGAQFAEVRVDEDLGVVRVARFVSVHDIGRVMNEKTAASQVRSGVIYGIGMALMEESHYDERNGRPVVRTLADYHFPAHADIPPIEVILLNKPDPRINALGARGVGEIGITGVAAAIANAIFNATGKRIRNLPITPDKLL